jgi:hypothetical protein
MKKLLVCILPMLFVLASCTPIEQQARNTAAALQGTIVAAQTQYQTSCVANPSQKVCVLINNGIAGENALITAIETYCGWSVIAPPTNPNAACVPVKGAEAALTIAISNATALTLEIKGAI